ncbi:MAG: elongation factor G [Candidatus Muiribacterium halophilum]|uniref:Elongation factor G n=1 Tax=Muiribacterium halophilum TaxID=2053465 RepID=A0A2N5ZGG1_MUIH1|nr:MAG: elongation factor G [Candidatus Muirbacterium halophilum]
MKFYDSNAIRNVVLVGGNGTGKTSIAEAMLFNSGANNRLGSVDAGTAVCDFLEEETDKKMSISGTLATFEVRNTKINLMDTPGSPDFMGEVIRMARVADAYILTVDASSGVDAQTIRNFEYVEGKSGVVFINKMEVERANFENALTQVKERISSSALPITIPMGKEKDFKGVIDLINEKAITCDETGKNLKVEDIPAEYSDMVASYKEQLVEAIVETDEALMEKYLEGEEISAEQLMDTFVQASKKGELIGVLCGAAGKNIGVQKLTDIIVDYMPSPAEVKTVDMIDEDTGEEITVEMDGSAPVSAFVFKTMSESQAGETIYFRTYTGTFSGGELNNPSKSSSERVNQINSLCGKEKVDIGGKMAAGDIATTVKLKNTKTSDTLYEGKFGKTFKPIEFPPALIKIAIVPKTQADKDKLSAALTKLTDEDPTLNVNFNPEFLQTIVLGMGEQHINVLRKRLSNKFSLEVEVEKPRIAYRETIRAKVTAEKKYKKQSGGKGQYGHCVIEMGPIERGKGFEFEDKIFGGAIPAKYIPSIEKGCKEAMDKGVLAGYPVIDIKVVVMDGSFHAVDSSDMAFKLAGSMAFKDGMEKAKPVLLEPISLVTVIVPDEYMGDIMGDMNGRRGRIMGSEAYKKGFTKIKATVPEAEMFKYINDLRSMTQGQGTFLTEHSHYDPTPANVQDKVIEETKKLEEEAEK